MATRAWVRGEQALLVLLQCHKSDCQPEQPEKTNKFIMIYHNNTRIIIKNTYVQWSEKAVYNQKQGVGGGVGLHTKKDDDRETDKV